MKYNSTALTAIKALQGAPLRAGNMMLLLLMLVSFGARAQWFWSASSSETQYPNAPMVPSSYNLDKLNTKYISNFAYPGSGPLMGSTINIDGWSTDNDGGFSYGLTDILGVYTGMGAQTIPNARDVQVGYMEFSGHQYIVASYYDVVKSMYAYDLYACIIAPSSLTVSSKLYTYHFPSPEVPEVTYIPETDYLTSYPLGTGGLPILTGRTMGYNRISMDINSNAQKIAIVLTDGNNGYMYTAVGNAVMDSIIFSPYLPGPGGYPSATTSSGTSYPTPNLLYPATPGYTLDIGGTFYYLYDATSGFHVRYYISGPYSGQYHYSYYPLDQDLYVSEYDATGLAIGRHSSGANGYSPLIGLKAVSRVTSPPHLEWTPPAMFNPYYLQYWPDVAFNGDDIRYVFYAADVEMSDLYINEPTSPYPLSDLFYQLYNYTGCGPYGPYPSYFYKGPNDMPMVFVNSYDGKSISAIKMHPTYSSTIGVESWCASLPFTSTVPEIRAELDAPDLFDSRAAITFAYTPDAKYDIPTPIETVHDLPEVGKHNIYTRHTNGSWPEQGILTNGSMGYYLGGSPYIAINTDRNVAPTIAYEPMSSNFSVAWASERAGAVNSTPWGYVAARVNSTTATGSTSPVSFMTFNDYLYIAGNPALDCGRYPLVALSKHTDGLSKLYTCFTQDDGSDYSIVHKSSDWTNVNTWRKTEEGALPGNDALSVGPNPFTNSLHISSIEEVTVSLMDIAGRELLMYKGAPADVNKQLDTKVQQLATGAYILNATTDSGKKESFKVTKQ